MILLCSLAWTVVLLASSVAGNSSGDLGTNSGNDWSSDLGSDSGTDWYSEGDLGSDSGTDWYSDGDLGSDSGTDWYSEGDLGSDSGTDWYSDGDLGSDSGTDWYSEGDLGSDSGTDWYSEGDLGSDSGIDWYPDDDELDWEICYDGIDDDGECKIGSEECESDDWNAGPEFPDDDDIYTVTPPVDVGGETGTPPLGGGTTATPPADGGSSGTAPLGCGTTGPPPVDLDGGITKLTTCGLSEPPKSSKRGFVDLMKRIVGGEEAKQGQYPWIVVLGEPDANQVSGMYQLCGGTLVSKQWVLTAAHCFLVPKPGGEGYILRPDVSQWIVRVGEHNLEVTNPNQKDRKVSRIIVFPEYTPNRYGNDIALMKLDKPVQRFGSFINIACVSNTTTPHDCSCVVAGWGKTAENSMGGSNKLLKLELPLLNAEKCGLTDPGRLCAGHIKGGKDSCSGDSGGPLVCIRGGRAFLTGIVSYGEGCARKNSPGVYNNVAYYVRWIQKAIASKPKSKKIQA